MQGTPDFPLVSIIIPCYNQAGFLPQAIESSIAQSYPSLEVVVIDDGSSDDSFQVASRYPGLRLIRQENLGLSEARNKGIENSRGDYLLFLDADDRLLPEAIRTSVAAARDNGQCGFVFGRFYVIDRDGARILTGPASEVPEDAYGAMLSNKLTIGCPATVLYRRGALSSVGRFEPQLGPTADVDMYLRISRTFPIGYHDAFVTEYRQHGGNMSRDAALMLRSVTRTLRRQWHYARTNPVHRRDYRAGVAGWGDWYGPLLSVQMKVARLERHWRSFFKRLPTLIRYRPMDIWSVCFGARRSNSLPFFVSPEGPPASTRDDGPRATGGRLVRLGIEWTRPGERFNVQRNGLSALWLECRSATHATQVVFAGRPVKTEFESPAHLTAAIPVELYSEPGRYEVYLVD